MKIYKQGEYVRINHTHGSNAGERRGQGYSLPIVVCLPGDNEAGKENLKARSLAGDRKYLPRLM